MIVDLDVEELDRTAMVSAVRHRWLDASALVLIRSSAPRVLTTASEVSDTWLFKTDERAQQLRKLGLFMRGVLDQQLWRTARLIHNARARGLTDSALDTYVLLHVLGLPRRVAAARLGVSEKGMEKRVSELCKAWGTASLSELFNSSARSLRRDPPRELMEELERNAERELAAELAQRSTRADEL